MSKERLEKLLNKMYYAYLDEKEAQEVINYIKKLEKENKMLRDYGEKVGEKRNQLYDKIEEAKEYIYINWITYDESTKFTTFNEEMKICIKEIKELLEILGDKENE